MHFYLACGIFIVSFLSYAQEPPLYKLATQDMYDLRYNADVQTKILFAQAQHKLKKNSQDETALNALARICQNENPYIPAVRQLVVHQLWQGNTDEALRLASIGQSYGDLSCLYFKACLLLKGPQEVPSLASQDPFNLEISGRQLLEQAQQSILLKDTKGRDLLFHIPAAAALFQRVHADQETLYDAAEKSLQSKSDDERKALENENASFMQRCYLVKNYGIKDPDFTQKETARNVLAHVEDMIDSADFNYDILKYSGAYQVLERIALDEKNPEYKHASFLLGLIDSQRMSFDLAVEPRNVERHLEVASGYDKRALLMLAHYAKEPSDQLSYLEKLSKSLDEIDPSDYHLVFKQMVHHYHALVIKDQTKYPVGLVRLLKSNLYKSFCDHLVQEPDVAYELGLQLLELYEGLEKNTATKKRADSSKILDAATAICQASAQQGNLRAAWALVDYQINSARAGVYLYDALQLTLEKVKKDQPLEISRPQLVHRLTELKPEEVSYESCRLLTHLYLLKDGIVPYDETKAFLFLRRVQEGAQAGEIALSFSDLEVCFNAGVVLHSKLRSDKKNMPERDVSQLLHLFVQAINAGDLALRKKIVNYCLRYRELVEIGLKALERCYENYYELTEEKKKGELSFFNDASEILKRWATGRISSDTPCIADRHPAAIMYLYEYSKQFRLSSEHTELVKNLIEWAAFKGYVPALRALEDEFQTTKKDIPSVSRAVLFWHAWINSGMPVSEESGSLKRVQDKIDELSAQCLERVQAGIYFMTDSFIHYQLANMLMERNPERALEHIFAGEALVKARVATEQGYESINNAGTFERVVCAAQKGQLWAKYALAKIKADRIELFMQAHINDHRAYFAEVEEIKRLLAESRPFYPTGDAHMLTDAQLDYMESYVADELEKYRPDSTIHKRGSDALEAAISKGHPDALYAWADKALVGLMGSGQEVLEKAIDRLCLAMQRGNAEASIVLQSIDKDGFNCVMPCGGVITSALREKVIGTLKKCKIPAREIPEPEKDSVSFAIYLFNRLENLPHAHTILKKAAENDDVRALVYLGIMHRDGLVVEQSTAQAHEYFMRALHSSRSLKRNVVPIPELNMALEALREADLAIAVQRCCYLLDRAPFKNEQDFNKTMDDIEAVENLLIASNDLQTNNLLYTSGLLQSLVATCANTQSVKDCMRIARLCANRCLKSKPTAFDEMKKKSESSQRNSSLSLLNMPFAFLRELLADSTLGMSQLQQAFKQIPKSDVLEFISLLQQMVDRGFLEPFEEVLGTLKVAYGMVMSDRALAERGIAHWETAEKNGDMRAAYMWALVKLRGNTMGPMAGVQSGDKILIKKLFFTYAPKLGVAKLEALAAKGHLPALTLLGQWYLENDNPEAALTWFRKFHIAKPDIALGAEGFLAAVCRKFAKATPEDHQRICAAVATTQKSETYKALGALYASYLRLVRGVEGITDEQALDYIIHNAGAFILSTQYDNKLLDLLKDTEYQKKIILWVEKLEIAKTPVVTDFLIKAYLAQLNISFLCVQNKMKIENANEKIIDLCNKILKIKPQSIEAESIKAYVYYLNGAEGDKTQITSMKLSVMKCCKILTECNLKLDAAPALNMLLGVIQKQGAYSESVQKDREWARAIAIKYSVNKS